MRAAFRQALSLVASVVVLGAAPAQAQSAGAWEGGGAGPPAFHGGDSYRGYPRDWHGRSVGFDNGYADGYREGFDDARDRDRFEPYRERRYRAADYGYHPRYGPREHYKRDYRAGFLSGYERGYRDAYRRWRDEGWRAWDDRRRW